MIFKSNCHLTYRPAVRCYPTLTNSFQGVLKYKLWYFILYIFVLVSKMVQCCCDTFIFFIYLFIFLFLLLWSAIGWLQCHTLLQIIATINTIFLVDLLPATGLDTLLLMDCETHHQSDVFMWLRLFYFFDSSRRWCHDLIILSLHSLPVISLSWTCACLGFSFFLPACHIF